jgi:CBS domain containing-hemolysin-like protein
MTVPAAVIGAEVAGPETAMLAAIAGLFLVTVFLSVAEASLARLNRARVQVLVAEGRRGARALAELAGDPRAFVTPVRLLTVLCLLVQATLVGVVGERLFGVVGLVAAAAVNVIVVFVLGESAPKTWAVLHPEPAALMTAGPVRFVVRLPPVRLLSRALIAVTNLVVPGKGLEEGPYMSEEELLAAAELGVEEGVIEADERVLIESIIEFGDTVVREVMVPRPDMVTVDTSFRLADVMEVALLNGYSRLPVRGEGIDDVVGLVYAKDLMRAERDGKEHEQVAGFLRPPRFVPETKRVPELLREMQRDQFHMAVVVDEYGGTAGLVTLEDLIEELVGEIVDEFDVEDPLIEPLPGGALRVHARAPLDEINDLLDAQLPEGDWDTIGGLLYRELGHVPYEGESVDIDGWRLVAQRIQGRRIGRVRISRIDDHASGPRAEQPPDSDVAPDAGPGTDPDSAQGPDGDSDSAQGPASGAGPESGSGSAAGSAPGPGSRSGSPPGRSGSPPGRSGSAVDRARRDDRGQAGVEVLPLAVLVFVIGTLLAVNCWAVIDAKLATDAAAREATRHFVEADVTDATAVGGAESASVAAGLAALAAHGRDPSRASLRLSALGGGPGAGDGAAGFSRCARATFTASYEVPALTLPWVGGFGRAFEVRSSHSELVDPFRDGVPGEAVGCD